MSGTEVQKKESPLCNENIDVNLLSVTLSVVVVLCPVPTLLLAKHVYVPTSLC